MSDPYLEMTEPLRVTVECPECQAVHEDLDGFGFVYCPACGHCTHPSADGGNDEGYYCTVCGRSVEE